MAEQDIAAYLLKARESLLGAASECANERYNNCANRAYYACFQAAVAALVRERVHPLARAIGGVTNSSRLDLLATSSIAANAILLHCERRFIGL